MLNQPNSMERNESPNNSHQIQQNPLNKLNQKRKMLKLKIQEYPPNPQKH